MQSVIAKPQSLAVALMPHTLPSHANVTAEIDPEGEPSHSPVETQVFSV